MFPRLFEIGPVSIYTYGVLLAAAYLVGLRYAIVRARARGMDGDRVMDLGIYIIVSALVGAKLLLLIVEFDWVDSILVSIGAITCAVPARWPTAPVGDELLAA